MTPSADRERLLEDATRLQAALVVRDGPVPPLPNSGPFLEVSAYAQAAMPAAVYLEKRLKTVASRATMRRALDVIAQLLSDGRATALTFPWAMLTYEHTVGLPVLLLDRGYKYSSVRKQLAAMRGVLREAWRLKLMDRDTFARAADVSAARGEEADGAQAAGRSLSAGELRALFEVCARHRGPARARSAALLGVLYGCGLRRAEIVSLDLSHYDPETGRITVRGKGNKRRFVYVAGGAKLALDAWVAIRGPLFALESGALFLPVTKAGTIVAQRMTAHGVFKLLQRLGDKAGLASFSPHDFRRTYIGDLLDAGADIVTVQKLAGHADPKTTALYDRRGEREKQRAVSMLHVPYLA
jgi:site-specific recombinase XerC